jgi:hypothetical protein
MVGGKDPPRSRPPKLSLVERPPLSPVQASGICLPLAGVSTSIWWAFNHKHFTEMRRLAREETPFLLAMLPRATTLAW